LDKLTEPIPEQDNIFISLTHPGQKSSRPVTDPRICHGRSSRAKSTL